MSYCVIQECFSYPADEIVFRGSKKECIAYIESKNDCWLVLALDK